MTSLRRFSLLLLLPLLAVLLMPRQPVEALSVTGTVSLFCANWVWGEHTTTFDRDTSGLGSETYEVIITDSTATVVFYESYNVTLGDYPSGSAVRDYTTLPAPGLITFVLKSPAGNGFEEQIAYTISDTCTGDGPTSTPPPTFTPSYTPTLTPTATFTATPGPSPTPTATATNTPNYVMRSTVVYGEGQTQDVAIVYEISAGDIGIIVVGAGIFSVLVIMTFLNIRRSA